MKCPVCDDVRMREVEKNGVHIDVCPECKGVWLDRGELDKLLSGIREVRQEYDEWMQAPPPPKYGDGYGSGYGKPKKKHRVLDDLLDLF